MPISTLQPPYKCPMQKPDILGGPEHLSNAEEMPGASVMDAQRQSVLGHRCWEPHFYIQIKLLNKGDWFFIFLFYLTFLKNYYYYCY